MEIPENIRELKELILNPGHPDKFGYSDLNRRAANNYQLPEKSESKAKEEQLAIEILDYIQDFKSHDISKLLTYVKESDFSKVNIFNGYLMSINKNRFNLLQQIELVRFLLQLDADKVPVDLIQKGLAPLKTNDPWLYIEILSLSAPYKGLEFITYLIKSGNVDNNRLTHWLISWMKSKDITFVKRISNTLGPFIDNAEIKLIIKDQLDKRQIISDVAPVKVSLSEKDNIGTLVIVSSNAFGRFKEVLSKENNRQPAHAE